MGGSKSVPCTPVDCTPVACTPVACTPVTCTPGPNKITVKVPSGCTLTWDFGTGNSGKFTSTTPSASVQISAPTVFNLRNGDTPPSWFLVKSSSQEKQFLLGCQIVLYQFLLLSLPRPRLHGREHRHQTWTRLQQVCTFLRFAGCENTKVCFSDQSVNVREYKPAAKGGGQENHKFHFVEIKFTNILFITSNISSS